MQIPAKRSKEEEAQQQPGNMQSFNNREGNREGSVEEAEEKPMRPNTAKGSKNTSEQLISGENEKKDS